LNTLGVVNNWFWVTSYESQEYEIADFNVRIKEVHMQDVNVCFNVVPIQWHMIKLQRNLSYNGLFIAWNATIWWHLTENVIPWHWILGIVALLCL